MGELTKEWMYYTGDYEKEMQDIKLHNGTVVTMCWPNAGVWNVLEEQLNEKYNNANIPNEEVSQVRLTHTQTWGNNQ